MELTKAGDLPYVEANLGYVSDEDGAALYRVWPPSTGRAPESPTRRAYPIRVHDCRDIADELELGGDGFVFRDHRTSFASFLDEQRVKADYYPEMEDLLRRMTGATAAFVFDHNVRSVTGAAKGQIGVRAPVDIVHADYTAKSGPRRSREILVARGYEHNAIRRMTLVNIWRPLHGPVLDVPLAICHLRSIAGDDLIETPIEHYTEGDLSKPSHVGEILSVRHNPAHQWFYASEMQPCEILVFKGYDSASGVKASYTPHTGFLNPNCPERFTPRESIEVRALLVDAERV